MKHRGCHILVKAVVFAAFLWVPSWAGPIDDARRLVSEGKITEARELLIPLVEQLGNDPDVLVALAKIEPDGARSQELYRTALRLAPDGPTAPTALLGIADFYYARGFYNNAHRMAQQVIDLLPSPSQLPEARLLVGRCLNATGEYPEAIRILRPLMNSHNINTRQAAAHTWASAALSAGQPRDVIVAFAGTDWESHPDLLLLLARAYRNSGQRNTARTKERAAASARRAWKSRPLSRNGVQFIQTTPTPAQEITQTESAPVRQPTEPQTRTPTSGYGQDDSFSGGNSGYSLQVGAFGNEANAIRLRDRLRTAGIEAVIHKTGRLHRVWAGNYSTTDEARADMNRVRETASLTPVIVRNR